MALEFKRERAAGEMTMETRPVDLSDCGEEEYDWIVRSTPATSDLFTLVDDWSEREAVVSQRVDVADPGIYQFEELTEPTASTTAERFLAEWSGPELVQPATEIFEPQPNEDEEVAMSAASAVVEEVDLAEWSEPELVQPATEFLDTSPNADEEVDIATASAPAGEVDLAEWIGPELAPPSHSLDTQPNENDELEMSTASAPGTVPGAVATGSKTQNEVDLSEWSEPELAPPSDSLDTKPNEDDELEVSTGPAPGTVPGAVATGSKTQNQVDVTEASGSESAMPVESDSSAVPSLKYPPPIWDQVPVYPAAEFHATGAFLTRLSAINWTLVLATVMVMSICGVCAFAILKLVQLDQNKAPAPAQQLAKQPDSRVEAPSRSVDEKPAEPVTPGSETAAAPSAAASAPSSAQPESKSATAGDNKLARPDSRAEAPKNSTTRNVVAKAPSRTVLANRRNTTPSNPRQIARNVSTSHSSVSTPKSSPTLGRSSSTSRGSSPTSRGSSPSNGSSQPSRGGSPSSGRRTEPTTNNGSQSAPVVNTGNGSTRPRRVTPPPGP